MGSEGIERRSVSMYPQQWAAVESVAQHEGMSVSEALRHIVRFYERRLAQARALAADATCDEEVKALGA